MKNIRNSETCQTEIAKKPNKWPPRLIHPLLERTKEERSEIYGHNSNKKKRERAKKQIRISFPNCKLYSLLSKETFPAVTISPNVYTYAHTYTRESESEFAGFDTGLDLEKELKQAENEIDWEGLDKAEAYRSSKRLSCGCRPTKGFVIFPCLYHLEAYSWHNDYLVPVEGYVTNQSTVPVEAVWTGLETKKEREAVNAHPVSEGIRRCTMLNLSKWGQIKLSAFPDEAIDFAYQQLKHANPRDPFAWFISLCLQYCKDNKIAPNWNRMLALSREYQMPDNAPMTLGPLLREPLKTPKTGNATASKQWQAAPEKKAEHPAQYNAKLRANPVPSFLQDTLGAAYVDNCIADNLARWHNQHGTNECDCAMYQPQLTQPVLPQLLTSVSPHSKDNDWYPSESDAETDSIWQEIA